MTETVVHVTTLEQWKSVLDVWFKQGYMWRNSDRDWKKFLFDYGSRFLFLDEEITHGQRNYNKPYIEYSEFMEQQKEDNKMETVYVTREQLDLIKELKSYTYPFHILVNRSDKYKPTSVGLSGQEEKALLRHLGGDKTVEFKVKEPLYRLWRMETNDRIYMRINNFGTPIWTVHKDNAFTATLDEIKKWQTPAWNIEKVDD